MALLEFIDLLTGFILGVFHRLTDLVPPLVCLVGCDVLARLLHFFCRFLSVAPRLLCRTFALLHNSLIGKLFVADSFSNALLYLSHRLLNLARNLILIHCSSPCRRKCGVHLCVKYLTMHLGGRLLERIGEPVRLYCSSCGKVDDHGTLPASAGSRTCDLI